MRISQLLETTDLSFLSASWKNDAANDMLLDLRKLGSEEDMLADIIEAALKNHVDSSPEQLLSFVAPLINASRERKERGEIFSSFTYHLKRFLNNLVFNLLDAEERGISTVKKLLAKVKLNDLAGFLTSKNAASLKLVSWKISRTKKQEKEDAQNQQYVFIGRTAFKENSQKNFRKTLEIENLVPVDKFNQDNHQMIQMMKIRARFQGEGSEVYTITLPKNLVDPGKEIPEWIVGLIDEHKTRVVG